MFRRYRKWTLLVILAGAVIFGVPPPGKADFKLRLSDDQGHTLTLTDADKDGLITYAGSFYAFNVVVTVGASKPLIGNPYSAEIDLTSFTVSTNTGGKLFIDLTDTSFNVVPGSNNIAVLTSSIGGNITGAGSSVAFQSWVNYGSGGNNEFGGLAATTGSVVTTGAQTNLTGGFYSGLSQSFTLVGGGPFSLTNRTGITLIAGTTFSSTDGHTSVTTPAPSALVTGLFAVAILGCYGWRRFKVAQVA